MEICSVWGFLYWCWNSSWDHHNRYREGNCYISLFILHLATLWILNFILSIAKGVSHSVVCLSISYSKRKREKHFAVLEIQKLTKGFWSVAKMQNYFPQFFERVNPPVITTCIVKVYLYSQSTQSQQSQLCWVAILLFWYNCFSYCRSCTWLILDYLD